MTRHRLLSEIEHSLLPSIAMPGGTNAMPLHRQQVGVLVGESVTERLFVGQDPIAETDHAFAVIRQSGGDSISSPHKLGPVPHGVPTTKIVQHRLRHLREVWVNG